MFERLFGLESISPDTLHQLVQQLQVTVIDVNSDMSWMTAHVPGAVHLDPVAFTDGDLPADKYVDRRRPRRVAPRRWAIAMSG